MKETELQEEILRRLRAKGVKDEKLNEFDKNFDNIVKGIKEMSDDLSDAYLKSFDKIVNKYPNFVFVIENSAFGSFLLAILKAQDDMSKKMADKTIICLKGVMEQFEKTRGKEIDEDECHLILK